jgi:predicted transcriptional regulator
MNQVGFFMTKEAFTIRTDNKQVEKLDELAKLSDRSRNYLVNEAIGQYLDLHAWQLEQVKSGIRAAEDGRFASDEEMVRIFGKYQDKSR